jgi:hypothetical protein
VTASELALMGGFDRLIRFRLGGSRVGDESKNVGQVWMPVLDVHAYGGCGMSRLGIDITYID